MATIDKSALGHGVVLFRWGGEFEAINNASSDMHAEAD